MTPIDLVILHYVQNHPNTRRGTVVDALSYGDRSAGHRIRVALDSLTARGLLTKSDTKPTRYTVPALPLTS